MLKFCQLNVLIYLLGIPLAWGQNTVLTTTTIFPGGTGNVLICPVNTYSASFAGKGNVAIGPSTAANLIDGTNNAFIGDRAGKTATLADRNTAIGERSETDITGGSDKIWLGTVSGLRVTTGSANTLAGPRSGSNITTRSSNCFIGNTAGYSSIATFNNSFVESSAGQNNISRSNNILLERRSGMEDTSGLVLVQYARSQSAEHFLMVDEQGKVILLQPRVRVANPDAWAGHVFRPGYALPPVEDAVAYGRTYLPGLPSAEEMVGEDWSLQALVKSQMEKIEELTLYIIELEKENESLEAKAGEIDELRTMVEKVQAPLEQTK
jgi:trimeric autotransporter adhesin